ncbi:MAG: hypothetical protein WDN06_08160 [Asticcacaulis sp.]
MPFRACSSVTACVTTTSTCGKSTKPSRPRVLANVAALEDRAWIARRTGITRDFGPFPWERTNPNGSSIAIGHPFAATGARDLSQCVKELFALPSGSRAVVSVCADGGQGVVALLERP